MSTQPVVKSNVSLTSILQILQIVLAALETIPAVGPEAALAIPFINIFQAALVAYHAAAGQALDLTKIPLETPIP